MTQIHATRLMLPNTPDRATVAGGGCEAARMAAAATKEAMMVMLTGASSRLVSVEGIEVVASFGQTGEF